MLSCTKTYYASINVDPQGQQTVPIARDVQATREMSVGVVTSVPISHATPAAAYANNVSRDDFQDLARDLLGLSSVAHRQALAGVDVLLGAGAGDVDEKSRDQGANFVPGNRYLTAADRERIDVDHGGEYVAVERVAGVSGSEALQAATQRAIDEGKRLFGMFGVGQTDGSPKGSHLPYRTADGRYDPTPGGYGKPDDYDGGDLKENPTLAEMTTAALAVLEQNPHGFWLMVEAGDVDWANHENNLDASIGAVISGDDAFRAVVEWVERHDAWDDTAVIVTADHGHYLNLRDPSVLTRP